MQNLYKNFVLTFLVATFLSVGSINLAHAQGTTEECKRLIEQFQQAKVGDKDVGSALIKDLPKYCTEGAVYQKVSNFVYYIIGIIGVIFYIYGGYMYMVSGANESAKKTGKEVLLYTTIGLVLVISAVTLVNLIVRLITGTSN